MKGNCVSSSQRSTRCQSQIEEHLSLRQGRSAATSLTWGNPNSEKSAKNKQKNRPPAHPCVYITTNQPRALNHMSTTLTDFSPVLTKQLRILHHLNKTPKLLCYNRIESQKLFSRSGLNDKGRHFHTCFQQDGARFLASNLGVQPVSSHPVISDR